MGAKQRYHYVDLLRGFAALAVLFFHYRWFYLGSGETRLPWNSLLWPLYGYGGLAVQVFWVLSGFVFAVAYGNGNTTKEFFVHRVARLYPLHLATLLTVAALQAISLHLNGHWQVYGHNDWKHFALQLIFATNWFTKTPSFNAPIWSVSVEVLIYFVFLAYLKTAGLRLWPAIALSGTGLALASLTDIPVAQCLYLFFAGVAMSFVRVSLKWAFVAFVAAILAVAVTRSLNLAMYVGAPALLLLFASLDHHLKPLPKRWHWIGAITYAVYLIHMPLLIGIRTFTNAYIPLLPSPLFLAGWLASVILLAIPTFYLFEKPAMGWIRSAARPRQARPRAAQEAL